MSKPDPDLTLEERLLLAIFGTPDPLVDNDPNRCGDDTCTEEH